MEAPEGTISGPPLPAAGERLGDYLLLKEIGQGGMGVVFRAYDPRLRRSVALKVVRPQLSPENRARFIEEAQVTSQLQHPVIIPVHEVGEIDERVYYTMPLVRGRGLDEVLAEAGPGEQFQLLQIFARVARAVAFASISFGTMEALRLLCVRFAVTHPTLPNLASARKSANSRRWTAVWYC